MICKAHLRYTCDFITEFKGHTVPAMKIEMHIFTACSQYGHKRIHFSRVTYQRLVHVRSYFSTVFAVHLHVYTRMTGCKRGFSVLHKSPLSYP